MLFSSAPRNTLAYWLKGNALGAHLDRSRHSVRSSATALKSIGWFGKEASPEQQAAQFYLLNHIVAKISTRFDPFEPLPEKELELVKLYVTEASAIAARLYYYCLIICGREFRHNGSSWSPKYAGPLAADYPDITENQASEIFHFLKSFQDSSAALNHLSGVPDWMTLGPFVKMMSIGYYKCSWGSSFGGKKWGVISDALLAMVVGTWSAEMFADTAFTLAHNTYPIFNKGMLYSHVDKASLEKMLDCQRAGVIPQYLKTTGWKHDAIVKKAMALFPYMFEGEVDWAEVKKLGAVGHYGQKPPKSSMADAPVKKPEGVKGQLQIDHKTKVWVLEKRAA